MSITGFSISTRIFYRQQFYKQHQAEIGEKKKKKKAKAKAKQHPEVNFCYLKIVQFLHPRFHTKIDILKNVQK